MIIITIIILIFGVITYMTFAETIYFNKLRDKVVVGSKWYISEHPRYYKDINPFKEYNKIYLTVVNIKQNEYGVKYVQYKFDDDSIDSISIDEFICNFSYDE